MNNENENNENENIDNDPISEGYNEQLLKQTVFTFSKEGISNDLKYFIQKKVSHNKTNLSYLTQLLDLALNDESLEITLKKDCPLKKLMEHVQGEIVKTDILINKAIEFVLNKDPGNRPLKDFMDGK